MIQVGILTSQAIESSCLGAEATRLVKRSREHMVRSWLSDPHTPAGMGIQTVLSTSAGGSTPTSKWSAERPLVHVDDAMHKRRVKERSPPHRARRGSRPRATESPATPMTCEAIVAAESGRGCSSGWTISRRLVTASELSSCPKEKTSAAARG